MNIKLRELEGIVVGLQNITTKMPAKTAYWMGKFQTQAKKEVTDYFESRRKLLDEYGEKGEDGNLIVENNNFKVKDISKYNKEFIELSEQEVEIPFRQMPLESFYTDEKAEFSIQEMEALERFVAPSTGE